MEQKLQQLITAIFERPHDEASRRELADLLQAHPSLVDDYVEQARAHCLLEWSFAKPAGVEEERSAFCELTATAPEQVSTVLSNRTSRGAWQRWKKRLDARQSFAVRRSKAIAIAVAATLACVAVGDWMYLKFASVGRLVAAQGVVWTDDSQSLAPGDKLRRGTLEATAGSCSLKFNSGAEMFLDGAFRIQIANDMHVRLQRGKIRASVPQNARGFTVDTPDTLLVDLGTEFGINSAAGAGTDVVVFRGEVDVHTKQSANSDKPYRLTQGEGAQLRLGRKELDRVLQVTSGGTSTRWAVGGNQNAIFSIRDNIRAADSLKYYNVVVHGLYEDVPAWVDRPHEWNGVTTDGIPEIVRGADYAMTFNDDRYNPSYRMFVNINRPANLYVFVDNRVKNPPTWLTKDFKDTGEDLGLDEGWCVYHQMESARGAGQSIDQTFSIWRREIPKPCELELGSLDNPGYFGMYGLAAKPLE